jgi:glycosyltransferase involved in cell wall biosynthesis
MIINKTKVNVIVPCYNAAPNLPALKNALLEQDYDNFEVHFIDDMSSDATWVVLQEIIKYAPNLLKATKNTEKKWALRNIVEKCREIAENRKTNKDELITIVDGDDLLINTKAISYIASAFDSGNEFIYTAHKWDIDGRNISKVLPAGINPYHSQWVTSHLRAFSLNLFLSINNENFLDAYGEYFTRGYDQALSLTLLFKSKKTVYIPKVCYQYNMNSCSMPNRNDGGAQLNTVKFIRARGFIT